MRAFQADVRSEDGAPASFIPARAGMLSKILSGADVIEWLAVVRAFQSEVRRLFPSAPETDRAHALLEQAYATIGEMAHRLQLSQRLEAEGQNDRLNRIVQTMSTSYDAETLMRLLAQELPGLGIESCFLSLYDGKGEAPEWSRLILACLRQQRQPLEPGGVRFATRQLLPPGMLPEERRWAFDVEALYFQDQPIGLVLFEIGPRDGDVYTTLRGHLSSALKSAELVQVALEAEAKARKADQLKTHLLANVSHELRTPINIILGLSQTALSSPSPYEVELPPRLAQDLKYVYDCGEHLVRLINDLLDMSRAEIGELDLRFEAVSPPPLLRETFESFKDSSAASRAEVQFVLDIPEHLPIIPADPVRLRQILMNLLSNALKFTDRGTITLGAEAQVPHLHLWVADSGLGIPLDLQERIFEPFVKADRPGKRTEGIGLGLSITRRLVTLHGGSITLESQPNRGSTFHVYLPLPGLDRALARPAAGAGGKQTLLWISANKAPPPVVSELCRKNDFSPRWINHRDEVEALLSEARPAAVAWDLENTRPGDWSIIQQLRGHAEYADLPLLLFQGHGQAERSPVTNVILKPVGKQTLQHVLDLLPQAPPHGDVWIVDDDPQALEYYGTLVGGALPEYSVRRIHGGAEALSLMREVTPALVLLDLMMPEVSGFEVLEHLRANRGTSLVPVIVLTGKMLSYDDVKRLDAPQVFLQTKGILTEAESADQVQQSLSSKSAESALPPPTSQLVKQTMAHIQQNYTRTLSLQELADTVGVSKSYLSRIFRADAGIPLWDYLNRFRVQKAKELLALTERSITEVAADVGFEDASYFGRVFREIAGCPPRAYRAEARKESDHP